MITKAEELLLEQMQKLDKQIETEETALTYLNKQVGQKISKIGDLKEQRRKISSAYNDLSVQVINKEQQATVGLTVGEVK